MIVTLFMYYLLNCVSFMDQTLAKVIRFNFHLWGCGKRMFFICTRVYTLIIRAYILIFSSKRVDIQYVD